MKKKTKRRIERGLLIMVAVLPVIAVSWRAWKNKFSPTEATEEGQLSKKENGTKGHLALI